MQKPLPSVTTLLILSVLFITLACSTTEQTRKEQRDEKSGQQLRSADEISRLNRLLSSTRSRLADVYASQHHDIPTVFTKRDTLENSGYTNPFSGYRIQIFSTRDVSMADSVSKQFRIWADTTFTGYQPEVYVFFRQPHYKVHVGNFQRMERANILSQKIKSRYPDAWVVHDRIDPSLVPADTVSIELQ